MGILETIKLSKNTSAQWVSLNPILADKEIGIETDTKLFKVGDGANHWVNLAYVVSNTNNALFVYLSQDQENLLELTADGGIILRNPKFNAVTDYTAGKVQGQAALIPPEAYNMTLLKVGQDVNVILKSIADISNRVVEQESKPIGDKLDDSVQGAVTGWSSNKVKDTILTEINSLKTEISDNAGGAFDALNRLSDLLQNNSSLALTITEELGTTVRFSIDQTLTDAQQAQARGNIGAVGLLAIGDTSTLLADYEESLLSSLNSPFERNDL